MRLDKCVAHLGYGSRKQVKAFIRKGYVSGNGEIILDDDFHVDETNDEIHFLEETINYEKQQYFLINKPIDTICSQDRSLYPSVLDLIEEPLLPNTQPVGRLDVDTTGALLITNDGQLAHRLLSPKHHVDKVYDVVLEKAFEAKWITQIEKGMVLSDHEHCLPAKVSILNENRIELTLSEGKYHQVKRMMHACDNQVVLLHRKMFSILSLDNLEIGHFRSLSTEEIKALKSI